MTEHSSREDLSAKGEQEYDEAIHQLERGEATLAFEHFELAEQVFLELQDRHWLTFIRHERFRLFLQTEQYEPALALAEDIIEGYLETQNKKGLALIQIHKADILLEQEKPLEALTSLRIAEAIVSSESIDELAGYLYSSLALVLIHLEDYFHAIQELNAALDIFPTEKASANIAWCQQMLGQCHWKLFDLASAERHFVASHQGYLKLGDTQNAMEVIDQLKQLYTSSDQIDKLSELNRMRKQKRF